MFMKKFPCSGMFLIISANPLAPFSNAPRALMVRSEEKNLEGTPPGQTKVCPVGVPLPVTENDGLCPIANSCDWLLLEYAALWKETVAIPMQKRSRMFSEDLGIENIWSPAERILPY